MLLLRQKYEANPKLLLRLSPSAIKSVQRFVNTSARSHEVDDGDSVSEVSNSDNENHVFTEGESFYDSEEEY